mgnify:CR=1 FL=1|jgi:uncharacterized protein (DUF1697 family)
MADTGNLLFDVSSEVGAEIVSAKKEALKARPIEFGKKRASSEEWRTVVQNNPKFRESEVQRLGMKKFLAQWRGMAK